MNQCKSHPFAGPHHIQTTGYGSMAMDIRSEGFVDDKIRAVGQIS